MEYESCIMRLLQRNFLYMEQLKAKAYDAIVQIEIWQNELKRLNAEIAKLSEEKKEDAK